MRIARKWLAALALALLLACIAYAKQHRTHHAASKPGEFDFYVLALSWSPEFCYSHRESPECQDKHFGFVVHGLWPQFTNGYPENCSNAPGPSHPESMTDIMPDASLVEHEWARHGTCSGLDADAYFKLVRQAYSSLHIPAALVAPHQSSNISPDELKEQFVKANPRLRTEDIRVSCGNNYLTAVSVCFTKSLDPADCGSLRDCRATTIRVPPVR